jgi:hypothetical protein
MKKILLLGALLAPFFVSAQALFDGSSSEQPFPSDQIRYKYGTGGGDDALFAYSESGILSNFHSTQCNFTSGDTTYQMTGSSVIRRDDGTLFQINCDRYSFRTTATGTVHSERNDTTGANTTPRIFASEICGENATGPSSYTFRKNDLCYDPAELAANDTCDTSNIFQAETTDDTICGTKNDGSMCESERVITVLFSPNGSGACYFNAEVTNETIFPEIPPPETCEVGADGYLFCASNGEANNGFDKDRYCGSYNIGGGATEVCFDKDDDSDLVPNHTDTDLDGDGIPNDDDPDVDNDGISNADDPDYTPSSGQDTGTGGDNDSGGGGGGGISGSIGDLIEQVDINSDAGIAGIEAIGSNFGAGVDAFLADENLNMVETINSNNVASSLDKLTDIVTPTACDLSFTAPFRGGMTIELCPYVEPLKPILAIFFAVGTFIYGFRRIFETIRGAQ